MAQTKEKENTVPAARAKQNAAAAPAAAGEKRPRTTRRPYYNPVSYTHLTLPTN